MTLVPRMPDPEEWKPISAVLFIFTIGFLVWPVMMAVVFTMLAATYAAGLWDDEDE